MSVACWINCAGNLNRPQVKKMSGVMIVRSKSYDMVLGWGME